MNAGTWERAGQPLEFGSVYLAARRGRVCPNVFAAHCIPHDAEWVLRLNIPPAEPQSSATSTDAGQSPGMNKKASS